MLHWCTIKDLIHTITGKSVEKSAIFELTNYFEEEIKKVILQSEKELKKLNKLKESQGLYQKNRIDRNCIKNAIKNLNKKNIHRSASIKDAGMVIEKKENFEVQ